MLSLEFPFFFANVCLHIQYDFVMSDQNFILTFLVLALRVIARFSYDVVNRWNERWLGNIISATDHELWRCKGKKTVPFPIAFPSGSGRRALILHFPFFFDDWFRIPNFCHLYPKYRFVCQNRIPSQNFGESLFQASGQFPYPEPKNFVCSPNSAQYFGQIQYPEKTLPDEKMGRSVTKPCSLV